MDPNSSPWAYAYNRIVPSATGSSDDFQHTHLAQISAAAGSSAQSLLLQAAHSSIAGFNATSGNFVPPTPIGGYNPVFQQIYHHAAQAAVQPKPAHYASSAVSTSHRNLGLTGNVEKQEICRSQPSALGYTTNQSINIPTSSYYGENSSSSGASPSPTTSATSSTTLSWNTPVIGTPQQMSANTFLTMHQQQQAQQQATINQVEKVINSKQSNLQMKANSKNYEDLIYVGNHEQHHEQSTHQLDNQIIQAVSEEDCARSEEGFYTFVDGKLSYNIPAAVISSASLSNKLPISSIKVVTPRKHSSSESHHPTLQQGLRQIPSPSYPIYESPSLCSSVGSPPPAVNSVHNNDSANNSNHNNMYKSNTPTQAQTSLDVSNVGRGANSNNNNNRNHNYARNSVSNSSLSPTTSVGYSSVITSAFQAQQQQQLHQEHHPMQQSVCWPGSNTNNKLSEISKHDPKVYTIHSPHSQENNIYILPPSLQIKRTIIETVQQSSELPQSSQQVHQQMVENALHVMSSQRDIQKEQPNRNHLQPTESQQLAQSKQQHSVENVLATNNAQASQIQNTTKVEDVQKPIPTKKAPRKRQPKKTLLQNNDFSRTSQQNNNQSLQQSSRQQQQQQIQHHQSQQQQQVQQQQQQQHNGSFYDYNSRWMQPKVENNINIPSFGNNQQSQQTNPIPQPQPAHVQPSQTHPHISQISQYYPAFPQHVSTQYAACMSQNTNLYNLTPLGLDAQQEQQQQNVHQNAQNTLQQQNNSGEVQAEPEPESASCKVIVPNIEDELHFLTTADPKIAAKVQKNSVYGRDSNNLKTNPQKASSVEATNTYQPFEKKDRPGKKSAFMDSYLKFLQGERDESPPPLMKTGRKYNYQKPSMQQDNVNNNKRKSNDHNQSSNTSSVINAETISQQTEESSAISVNNNEATITGSDDGHKIKIISQTQILPKKRPQAQNIAAVIQQNPVNSQEASQHHQLQQQQQLRATQQQHSLQYRQVQQQNPNFHQDPLALPPRREQSLRKAKSRGINDILQATPAVTDRDEPEEFADSDADPVWTPQDDDSEDGMPGNFGNKRKNRRIKTNVSAKKKESPTMKDNTTLENDNKIALVSSTSNSISESTSGNAAENFKTGDFIVLRSDLVNDWPIIWQVDSKCILQKYESFCQNGKMFYRNMSKYASWNLDTKKLYIKAPVRIQVQSHTETIVEFMRSELLADDTEQFIEKIMEDYLTYRDHFEIYIQTMISQVLDPSFFSEINREKDEYFLSSVRTIDEIMENCKRKLLSITPWTRSVIVSIETWPQCHVFTEWGQNNVNQKNCGGCHQPGISVRFLLFGHPYNTSTMQTVPVDMRVTYEKDILLCRICAARADIFHKIAHEKYNLFAICTRRVGEHQKELPGKSSTDILNDLLAENNWVDELFRNMRSSWAEVESLERQKRFHEVSQ